ncbi:MAG: response regulator [Elusimicrobiota bacterium]|jgi:DNA-binding response OmpR family regulator
MPEPKRTVLIFEDNKNIQLLLRIFFQKKGFEANVSDDAVDAVALAKQYRPDIIFMDLIMPGKDGIEACSDLRLAGVKTPIVVLTSKSVSEDKARALQAGADAYLLKPFNPAEIEAAIRPLLQNG